VATTPTPHHDRHKLTRLAIAAVVGIILGLLVPLPSGAPVAAHVLVGFSVTFLAFALPMLRRALHATPEETREYADGVDPGRSISDIVVLLAALAALAGVGLMLASGGTSKTGKISEALITFATVGSAWLVIHLTYAMRYARHWFNAEADSIDFHMDAQPAYSDFVYLAFAVGSSFAVSDTDLKTTAIRRIALHQSWVSYLFGTVIVAATINLLAGLAA
jgi:uncharacterized membrane protein